MFWKQRQEVKRSQIWVELVWAACFTYPFIDWIICYFNSVLICFLGATESLPWYLAPWWSLIKVNWVIIVSYQAYSWRESHNPPVLFHFITRSSAQAQWLLCVITPLQRTRMLPKKQRRSVQRGRTTFPSSHPCPVESWDCSSDCRISINLEMQLDTEASDREGATLSRSISSLACHGYKRRHWFI